MANYKANSGSFKKGMVPWNKGKKSNREVWNKGLTKECDERVRRNVEATKKTMNSEEFKLKIRETHWAKGLNKENHKAIKGISERMKKNNPIYRPEVREKIRESVLRRYRENPEVREKIRNSVLRRYRENPEILENRKHSGINQYSDCYTSIEKVVVEELRKRKLGFVHNYKVGRFFPDFIVMNNVIIECDGDYWHKEENRVRDLYLMDRGYFVFHLRGSRILRDIRECIDMVIDVMGGFDEQTVKKVESKCAL